jgi:hypothetical protein
MMYLSISSDTEQGIESIEASRLQYVSGALSGLFVTRKEADCVPAKCGAPGTIDDVAAKMHDDIIGPQPSSP